MRLVILWEYNFVWVFKVWDNFVWWFGRMSGG